MFGAPLQFGFLFPPALFALFALPLVVWVSRLIAPPLIEKEFPAIFILKRLKSPPPKSQKPPLWQILLRITALAFVIFAIADPHIKPRNNVENQSEKIEIFIEDTFAQNQDWSQRCEPIIAYIENSITPNIDIYFINNPTANLKNQNAAQTIKALKSAQFLVGENNFENTIKMLGNEKARIFYFGDGIKSPKSQAFFDTLSVRAIGNINKAALPNVKIIENVQTSENQAQIKVFNSANTLTHLNAMSFDGKIINSVEFTGASFAMQIPKNSRPAYYQILDQNHAGAIFLTENYGAKPSIGIVKDKGQDAGLLSDAHFLNAAASLENIVKSGSVTELIKAGADILVIGDSAGFSNSETALLKTFMENGGTIIRFLGPKSLAKPEDEILTGALKAPEHNLIGQIGPNKINIEPFSKDSIFSGLEIPANVLVEKSVLLEEAHNQTQILAKLSDGAPLISQENFGKGKLFVIHTSATPIWSQMSLSPLQFQILERIFDNSNINFKPKTDNSRITGYLLHEIDSDGRINNLSNPKPIDNLPPKTDATHPPGIYSFNQNIALNVAQSRSFEKAQYPDNFKNFDEKTNGIRLRGPLFLIGLLLLLSENILRIFLNSRIFRNQIASALIALAALLIFTHDAFAETKKDNLKLSYLITNDQKTDNKAKLALIGLAQVLEKRTNIEPSGVIGLKPDSTEIFKQPILFWLLPPNANQLKPNEAENLNRFMANGGILFIDTAGKGQNQNQTQANLRRALSGLIVPPLEKVPQNHVLRKSFYILQGFNGFYQNAEIWVETANSAASNSLDGVSPIIIGDGDWATIWALSANSQFSPFDYTKEVPLRVGVNIYMYALTGQYKADQLHIDAILKRAKKVKP